MDVKELNLEELQHEHPLLLFDLQLMHRDYEEDNEDYDENVLIERQNFVVTCSRCGMRIDWYHRFYYKCSIGSCDYSIHKFCEEIPQNIKFQGHLSHTLILKKTTNDQKCHGCLRFHQHGICYHCSTCNYGIDLFCATFLEQNTVHHPSHPHPLICVTVEPILSKCFACGKKHEGNFYHCTTCLNFSINSDCLTLPIKLFLKTQQFSHRHFLTLSYSFVDRLYDFECRICGIKFEDERLIYKCSKCMYYVHPDCAMQSIEPFMYILSPGLGNTEKNFKDIDHPKLLHLPLPDESHILSHPIEVETCEKDRNDVIHYIHEHPLVLIHDKINSDKTTTSTSTIKSLSLHDPMKRTKLLCTACSRPITKMPLYKCSRGEDSCDFVLHDSCTRLPKLLKNHVCHPQHTLVLFPFSGSPQFKCRICQLHFTGFSYCCMRCYYFIDVNCGFIPNEITHEAHAGHLLTREDASSSRLTSIDCRACRVRIDNNGIYFRCNACDFYLDCQCALLLPKTIRHKCDKHSLNLSYSPIEDHKSQYFCEICEDDLDPGKWFYHCVECDQSIHSACAPLKLQSEQGVNSHHFEGVYKFVNIKFGAVKEKKVHMHPVSFLPGTENDGLCHICQRELQSNMIWKCLHCSFASHCHDCLDNEPLDTDTRRQIDSKWENQRVKDSQSQRNLEFYPTKLIRPMTRHWEVDDVQR